MNKPTADRRRLLATCAIAALALLVILPFAVAGLSAAGLAAATGLGGLVAGLVPLIVSLARWGYASRERQVQEALRIEKAGREAALASKTVVTVLTDQVAGRPESAVTRDLRRARQLQEAASQVEQQERRRLAGLGYDSRPPSAAAFQDTATIQLIEDARQQSPTETKRHIDHVLSYHAAELRRATRPARWWRLLTAPPTIITGGLLIATALTVIFTHSTPPSHSSVLNPHSYRRVPDVQGLAMTTALSDMRNAGLNCRWTLDSASAAPMFQVVGQAPRSGTKVGPGTTVAIEVSIGAGAESVSPRAVPSESTAGILAVPNVIGMTEAMATEVLRAVGFQVNPVQAGNPPGTTPGTVFGVIPDVGQQAQLGSMIDLAIASPIP
jgi:hypothetical protein